MAIAREPKPTVAIGRQQLLGLLAQSIRDEVEERPLSPIAVLLVLGLFTALFVAIIKVS
jgi:hypothetical protein